MYTVESVDSRDSTDTQHTMIRAPKKPWYKLAPCTQKWYWLIGIMSGGYSWFQKWDNLSKQHKVVQNTGISWTAWWWTELCSRHQHLCWNPIRPLALEMSSASKRQVLFPLYQECSQDRHGLIWISMSLSRQGWVEAGNKENIRLCQHRSVTMGKGELLCCFKYFTAFQNLSTVSGILASKEGHFGFAKL